MIRVRYFDSLICGWTGAWVLPLLGQASHLWLTRLASIRNYERRIKTKSNHSIKLVDPNQPLTKQRIDWSLSFCHSSNPSSTYYSPMPSSRPKYGVKCYVVNIHITPLEEKQHTTYQNTERIPNSHDYYQHDLSHVLTNKSNYSQDIIIIMTRGVMNSIKDLNINSSTK